MKGFIHKTTVILASFTATLFLLSTFASKPKVLPPPPKPPVVAPSIPKVEQQPKTPDISLAFPSCRRHGEVYYWMQTMNQAAPDLVDLGEYGVSTKGNKLCYMKISNEYKPSDKVVLITAAIHGNEPLSTSVVMAYACNILSQYGKDQEITNLVNTRTIYIVPVVSPDSYPSNREVDGVDPNRNFPGPSSPDRKSVAPVAALQQLHNKIKPAAVISGHTFGRILLYPYGDTMKLCPHDADFQRILGNMCQLSGYSKKRSCQMYRTPIYGTEADWYYRNGSFAIVMEFGTHQKLPTAEDTKYEFDKTFKAVLLFIKEAPEVNITP